MRRLWPLVLSVLLATGCSGSAKPQADVPTAPSTPTDVAPTAPATCPPATGAAFAWPEQVPDDLPEPPNARLTDVQERADGLFVVQFTTATSIREGVLFLVDKMPRAGYTLARGDAENTEADAPFVKGNLRGVMRLLAIEPCRTDWLMAITTAAPAGIPGGGGNPLLPARPGASPLPFG